MQTTALQSDNYLDGETMTSHKPGPFLAASNVKLATGEAIYEHQRLDVDSLSIQKIKGPADGTQPWGACVSFS